MASSFTLLGHVFFLLALYAGGTDLFQPSGITTFRSLRTFLINTTAIDLQTFEQYVKPILHSAFFDNVYLTITTAPAALVFLIIALIFWAWAAWFRR